MSPRWIGAAVTLGLVLASGRADASGFLAAKYGSSHGNPMTGNPYAVYFNPAVLGGIDGSQLTLDGNIAYRTADYTRSDRALSPSSSQLRGDPTYRDSNTGRAHLAEVLASPFLGAASNFGTNFFSAGVAAFVPFGGVSTWDQNDKYAGSKVAPGAADGPQRWSAISGSVSAQYFTGAVAFTLPSSRLSFGVNASLVRHSVKTVRARNVDGSDDIRDRSGALIEGRSLLDVSGSNLAIGVGLYYEPLTDRSVRLGVSYSSQPGFGEMRLKGNLRTQFGNSPAEQNFKVDLLQTYPDVLRAGVAWRVNDVTELRLDSTFVRWSVFTKQCVVLSAKSCNLDSSGAVAAGNTAADVLQSIPRNWKDAIEVRAGASLWASPQTELFASGGFDTSAVRPDSMDATFIDSFKVLGTVGVRRLVTKSFALAGSYNQVYYVPVDTAGQSTANTFKSPTKSPGGDGRYETSIVFVNLNATLLF